MDGGSEMELAHYCPSCGLAIQKVNDKYYCSECKAYFYIEVSCMASSPLLEMDSGG